MLRRAATVTTRALHAESIHPVATAVTVVGAALSVFYPIGAFAALVLAVLVAVPALSRLLLIAILAVTPIFNPALFTIGAGRMYLFQVAILAAIVGAVAEAVRTGQYRQAIALIVLVAAYVAVQTVGRVDPALGWVYRPLQPFLLAFAITVLFRRSGADVPLRALGWGAIIGCGLVIATVVFPYVDIFRASRPEDIPFVSTIGTFARATGAFVYPNNLGTFAAYAAVIGLAALFFDRPSLPRPFALALVITTSSALVLSGARAALLGLQAAVIYMTIRARPNRRVAIVVCELLAGLVILFTVTTSETARVVAEERVTTATRFSLTGRVEGWQTALEDFRKAPLFGSGATESRLDSMWFLYFSTGGIVGGSLLILLARATLRYRPPSYPELWMALILALAVSGTLQDSLGQTLASWCFGAGIAIAIIGTGVRDRGDNAPQEVMR